MAQRKAKGSIQIDIPPPPDLLDSQDKYNRQKDQGISRTPTLKYAIPVLIVLCVLWGEIGIFYLTARQCISSLPTESKHLFVVSDPQLTEKFSYSDNFGKNLWSIIEYYSDVYMQRYYWAFMRQQEFKATIFLGDLFDGVTAIMRNKEGRTQWTTAEYNKLKKRFEWVFPVDPNVKRFYVAGNHDIGYKVDNTVLKQTFQENFGPINYIEHFEGWDFVVIGSTLLGEESLEKDQLWKMIDDLKKDGSVPAILLSHIPLHRPKNSMCGNQRGLSYDFGYSYVTMVSKEDTKRILESVHPNYVLSGDVHRPCHYAHKQDNYITDEYTMNTFSWCQGNLYPGTSIFSMRSQFPSQLDHTLCTFHNQLNIFIFYGVMGLVFLIFAIYSERSEATSLMYSIKQGIKYYFQVMVGYGLLLYVFVQWIFL